MTADEVKGRLRAFRRACKECRELRRKIKEKRAAMVQPRAVKTDALPGGKGNSLEAAVEKIDALERRLQAAESARKDALRDVRALIALADSPDGRYILTLRYVAGVSFDDIPERVYISPATMWRRYNRAIDQIARKNDSE